MPFDNLVPQLYYVPGQISETLHSFDIRHWKSRDVYVLLDFRANIIQCLSKFCYILGIFIMKSKMKPVGMLFNYRVNSNNLLIQCLQSRCEDQSGSQTRASDRQAAVIGGDFLTRPGRATGCPVRNCSSKDRKDSRQKDLMVVNPAYTIEIAKTKERSSKHRREGVEAAPRRLFVVAATEESVPRPEAEPPPPPDSRGKPAGQPVCPRRLILSLCHCRNHSQDCRVVQGAVS